MAQTGLSWKLAVDNNSNPLDPGWIDLPGQRGGSMSMTHTDVDVSNKDNSGWEDSVSTRRGWTFDVDGVADENNGAVVFLVGTWLTGSDTDSRVNVRLTNEDGDTFNGWATLNNMDYDFPESDLVSYSCSFTGRGALTVTRA